MSRLSNKYRRTPAEIAALVAVAHARLSGLTKITGEALAGGRGFRYVGLFADGSTEIIRKASTRAYANAFLWSHDGQLNGADAGSLAGCFTWGKAPDGALTKRHGAPQGTFAIEYPAAP